MSNARVVSWVVYRMPIPGRPEGMNAVCEGREWAAMEQARPGYYTLVRAGISNEGEAERLARGTSGDRPPAAPRPPRNAHTTGEAPAAAAGDPVPGVV